MPQLLPKRFKAVDLMIESDDDLWRILEEVRICIQLCHIVFYMRSET